MSLTTFFANSGLTPTHLIEGSMQGALFECPKVWNCCDSGKGVHMWLLPTTIEDLKEDNTIICVTVSRDQRSQKPEINWDGMRNGRFQKLTTADRARSIYVKAPFCQPAFSTDLPPTFWKGRTTKQLSPILQASTPSLPIELLTMIGEYAISPKMDSTDAKNYLNRLRTPYELYPFISEELQIGCEHLRQLRSHPAWLSYDEEASVESPAPDIEVFSEADQAQLNNACTIS